MHVTIRSRHRDILNINASTKGSLTFIASNAEAAARLHGAADVYIDGELGAHVVRRAGQVDWELPLQKGDALFEELVKHPEIDIHPTYGERR